MHRHHLRATLAIAASLLVSLVAAPSSLAAPACTKFASPTGSDANPGTLAAPFATAQKLSDSLQPGDVGCLRAGTYVQDVKVTVGGTATGPVTMQSYPGERATLVGRLWIAQGADHVTFADMNIDGKNANLLPSPDVAASYTTFDGVDVTNEHSDICFILGSQTWGRAINTVIENSRIHDCGKFPSSNQDHGIYIAASTGAVIRGNVIYGNVDRGIQLYPDAQNTTIVGNVIDGNGEGISFGGDNGVSSSGTVVSNNVITNSNIRANVESYYPSGTPAGIGNVVSNNCAFGSSYGGTSGGIARDSGYTIGANVTADPLYVNRGAGDYRLQPGSPCAAVLNGLLDPTVAAGQASSDVSPAVASAASTVASPMASTPASASRSSSGSGAGSTGSKGSSAVGPTASGYQGNGHFKLRARSAVKHRSTRHKKASKRHSRKHARRASHRRGHRRGCTARQRASHVRRCTR